MDANWREQLKSEVRRIIASGGPPAGGTVIPIPVRLTKLGLEQFTALLGMRNARPVGEAPVGTLELTRIDDGKNAERLLTFRFHAGRPSPPSVRVFDFDAIPGLIFPVERGELTAIKEGRKRQMVVPVPRGEDLNEGDRVTFVESTVDPFGNPLFVPDGRSLSVTVTEIQDQNYPWAGHDLFSIGWDPVATSGQTAEAIPSPTER